MSLVVLPRVLAVQDDGQDEVTLEEIEAVPAEASEAQPGVRQFVERFAVFLTLVGVPWLIAATGRSDLYYTLTSVALLSIASGGVWLTFFIGRINIGQGAYALMGGYVSAILVVDYGVPFWLTLPVAGLFCAGASILIGLPILRLRLSLTIPREHAHWEGHVPVVWPCWVHRARNLRFAV